MIYMVGGCSRSGKTSLARRMLEARGIPYFGSDYMVRGLQNAKVAGISAKEDDRETTLKLRVALVHMVSALAYDAHDYLLEGVHLDPMAIRAAIDNIEAPIAGCLLGYPETAPEDKLAALEAQGRGANDWLAGFSRESQLRFLAKQREISSEQRSLAGEKNIAFFDSGADPAGAIEQAFQHLLERS